MGTGDGLDLGRVFQPSRGRKNFLRHRPDGKKCSFARDLRQFKSWRMCEDTPDRSDRGGSPRMSQFFNRYPEAKPWLFAASQAAAMLGFNVLLRAAVL